MKTKGLAKGTSGIVGYNKRLKERKVNGRRGWDGRERRVLSCVSIIVLGKLVQSRGLFRVVRRRRAFCFSTIAQRFLVASATELRVGLRWEAAKLDGV